MGSSALAAPPGCRQSSRSVWRAGRIGPRDQSLGWRRCGRRPSLRPGGRARSRRWRRRPCVSSRGRALTAPSTATPPWSSRRTLPWSSFPRPSSRRLAGLVRWASWPRWWPPPSPQPARRSGCEACRWSECTRPRTGSDGNVEELSPQLREYGAERGLIPPPASTARIGPPRRSSKRCAGTSSSCSATRKRCADRSSKRCRTRSRPYAPLSARSRRGRARWPSSTACGWPTNANRPRG